MKRIILMSAIMLFGTVAINAAEDKEWLSEGSLTERTENWAQSNSLKSAQENETPPGEPAWPTPVGNGMWCILAAVAGYALCKNAKAPISTQTHIK